MRLDLDKIKAAINNTDYSAYLIEKESGVSRATISNIRSGKQEFGRLEVNTLIKLQKWLEGNEHEKNEEKENSH